MIFADTATDISMHGTMAAGPVELVLHVPLLGVVLTGVDDVFGVARRAARISFTVL